MRVATLLSVVLPFAGLVVAGIVLWGHGFHWVHAALLGGMYSLTAIGVTLGYHRLFTHRSFETHRFVQVVLAILGSMAVQGPMLKWVAVHRLHHRHSDRPDDPHSPHAHGNGLRGLLRGIWHAHLGWLFRSDPPGWLRYAADLSRFRYLRAVSALFPLWVLLGLLIPGCLGWLLEGGWSGALLGLLWGGLVRVFVLHHVTWSVNSICHLWGSRPFPSNDQSRNNFLVGVLALGEGWHNNHHAFPYSARHGLRWWQLDLSYGVLRFLALLGLAWRIRLPRQRIGAA